MKIESKDRKSFLNIEYVDFENVGFPSVCFAITVQDEEFRGYNNVWFQLDLLNDFFKNLKALENTRNGSVSLNSMSPEEFQIRIETYDISGHMVLNYRISKYTHHKPKINVISLSGGFELDIEFFITIISQFTHLVDKINFNPLN